MRQIAQATRTGWMALCVQEGLAVLQGTMDHEVAERVGPLNPQAATKTAATPTHSARNRTARLGCRSKPLASLNRALPQAPPTLLLRPYLAMKATAKRNAPTISPVRRPLVKPCRNSGESNRSVVYPLVPT